MLQLNGTRRRPDCDGTTRRDFLKVGALAGTGVALPDLLRARAANRSSRNTSVVWLWLGGGPTHVETFDPKMSAPAEYRSVTGAINTNTPGIDLGSNFTKMAGVADKMAFVRSFAHRNSGHGGGTHWVMTGYDFPPPTTARRRTSRGWARSCRGTAARTTRPPACRPTSA
jgi:hypothetical protein